MPVGKIGAQNEIPGDLPLQTQVDVQRGRTRNMSGIERARLSYLDGLHRSVCIGQLLQEVSTDRRQNRHQIGAGEQRWAVEFQSRLRGTYLRYWASNGASGDSLLAEARRAEQHSFVVEERRKQEIVEHAGAGADHGLAVIGWRPGQPEQRRKVSPLFPRRAQAFRA
jgi:hypothetical protein